MEWYLVYTEKDKSLSIIDTSAIVSAGDISQRKFLKLKDHVTFVYAGSSYIGVIVGMSDSRTEIEALAKAEKTRMMQERKENVDSSVPPITSQKRKSQPPVKYGEDGLNGPSGSKKSSSSRSKRRNQSEPNDSTKKRILDLNLARANKTMNESILNSLNKKTEVDPNYKPDSSDSSDDSSSSEIGDLLKDSIRRKEERVKLLKNAKNSAGSSKVESVSSTPASPTKEELLRQLEEYKLKLQAAYDRDDSDHKLTPADDIEKFFDTEDKKLASDIDDIREEVNASIDERRDDSCKKKDKHEGKKNDSDTEEDKKEKKNEGKGQEHSDQEHGDNQNNSDRKEDKKKKKQKGKKQSDEDDNDDNDGTSESLNDKKSKLKTKNSGESDELDDADTYEYLTYQLYGKQKDAVHLMNGIYCDARELTSAIQASKEMTHMVRRLMVGVFKIEEILDCTFTGRRPTAAGADQVKGKKIDPLHPGAILAIIKYSKATAKSRKWTILRKKDLHTVITQKLGEMKRGYKKNAKNTD